MQHHRQVKPLSLAILSPKMGKWLEDENCETLSKQNSFITKNKVWANYFHQKNFTYIFV